MLGVEKILIILILKYLEQRTIDYLCNQNVVFIKIKSHDLQKKEQDPKAIRKKT